MARPGAAELLWANAGRPVGWEEACTYYGEAACTTEVPRDRTFDGDRTLYAIRWGGVTKAPPPNHLTCNGQAQPVVTAGTATAGPLLPTLHGEYSRSYARDRQVYPGTVLSLSPSVHVQHDAATRAPG